MDRWDRGSYERLSIRESAQCLKKYGSTNKRVAKNESYLKHYVTNTDTLQGIALKYNVTNMILYHFSENGALRKMKNKQVLVMAKFHPSILLDCSWVLPGLFSEGALAATHTINEVTAYLRFSLSATTVLLNPKDKRELTVFGGSLSYFKKKIVSLVLAL